MPEKLFDLNPPRGLARIAFRMPIWLYHLHMGWLMGTRFVLLTHTGRKSGLPHQTVIEVVRYDRSTGACVVASGWGTKSDWFQNITANPDIYFQVRNKRSAGVAMRLSSEEAGAELLEYARRHPFAFKELSTFMGIKLDGTEADIRESGKILPLFVFKPTPYSS